MKLDFFDLDHTLLKVNCSCRFGLYLYKESVSSLSKSMIGLFHYLRYKYFGMTLEKLHQKTFNLFFKNHSLEGIQKQVEDFLDKNFASMLNLPIIEYLRIAQSNGHVVYILSSSPDFLVKPIANRLGVLLAVATSYRLDAEKKFIALDCIFSGQEKADFVQKLVYKHDLQGSSVSVYSDSHHDLPLLNLAGEVIVVRPDSRLKRISEKNRWKIVR